MAHTLVEQVIAEVRMLPMEHLQKVLELMETLKEQLDTPQQSQNKEIPDWLAKCDAALASMPLTRDSAELLQEIRLERASR